jgi:hypothetical protein
MGSTHIGMDITCKNLTRLKNKLVHLLLASLSKAQSNMVGKAWSLPLKRSTGNGFRSLRPRFQY